MAFPGGFTMAIRPGREPARARRRQRLRELGPPAAISGAECWSIGINILVIGL